MPMVCRTTHSSRECLGGNILTDTFNGSKVRACWSHLSRKHYHPPQQFAMAIGKTLIVLSILFGCPLALRVIHGNIHHPSSSWPPQGITTFWTNSAPPERKVQGIVTCKYVLWRRYCRVLFVPKDTTSLPATTIPRITRTGVEKTAMAIRPYNRMRGILG